MATFGKYGDLLTAEKHKDFEYILKGVGEMPEYQISQLRQGDLILRKVNKPYNPFYHVGVYCGNGEIIEYTVSSDKKKKSSGFMSVSSSSSSTHGSVGKIGVMDFFKDQPYRIARHRYGIPSNFSHRVEIEMRTKAQNRPMYNSVTNNCLDFALRLLGLK